MYFKNPQAEKFLLANNFSGFIDLLQKQKVSTHDFVASLLLLMYMYNSAQFPAGVQHICLGAKAASPEFDYRNVLQALFAHDLAHQFKAPHASFAAKEWAVLAIGFKLQHTLFPLLKNFLSPMDVTIRYNNTEHTLLSIAAKFGNQEAVCFFVEKLHMHPGGLVNGHTPHEIAKANGHKVVAYYLWGKNEDIKNAYYANFARLAPKSPKDYAQPLLLRR